MVRTCPNCLVKLGSYDNFYCSSCGTELPEELKRFPTNKVRVANFNAVVKEKPIKKQNLEEGPVFSKPQIDYKRMFTALFIVSALVLAYIMIYSQLAPLLKAPTKEQRAVPGTEMEITTHAVSLPVDYIETDISDARLLEYLPFDADFVVVGSDFEKVSSAYLSVDAYYEDLVNEVLTYSIRDFAVFASKSDEGEVVWSLLLRADSNDFRVSEELLEKYNWLKVWKSNSYLLLTTSSDVLNSVMDANGRVTKNFTHTTLYSSVKSFLPEKAKAVVFIVDNSFLDVFTSSKDLLSRSQDLSSLAKAIVESKSNYLVIN